MGQVHHGFTAEFVLRLLAFGKLQRIESGLVAPGVPEIVRVDVHRVREA